MLNRTLIGALLLLGALGIPAYSKAVATSDLCPEAWVVSYENDSIDGTRFVEIAEGSLLGPGCQVKSTSRHGGSAKIDLEEDILSFDIQISPGAVCAEKDPCVIVVGLRLPTCKEISPQVFKVDGALTYTTKFHQTIDADKSECETELIIAGYIYKGVSEGTLRTLRGAIKLAYLNLLPARPVISP